MTFLPTSSEEYALRNMLAEEVPAVAENVLIHCAFGPNPEPDVPERLTVTSVAELVPSGAVPALPLPEALPVLEVKVVHGLCERSPELVSSLVEEADTESPRSVMQSTPAAAVLTWPSAHWQVSLLVREVVRSDVMLEMMDEMFPSEVHWTKPQGGMFLWGVLPEGMDAAKVLPDAIERKVAFVPGASFHATGGGQNTMRLNFSYSSPDTIREGITRLGSTLKEWVSRN